MNMINSQRSEYWTWDKTRNNHYHAEYDQGTSESPLPLLIFIYFLIASRCLQRLMADLFQSNGVTPGPEDKSRPLCAIKLVQVTDETMEHH